MIDDYVISYVEHGYNKMGDYSRAWISILTKRPLIFHEYDNDPYLDKIFPQFHFELRKDYNSMSFTSSNQILGNLRSTLDVQSIKKECEDLTQSIRRFAKLIFEEQKHAQALADYCKAKKTEIILGYENIARTKNMQKTSTP